MEDQHQVQEKKFIGASIPNKLLSKLKQTQHILTSIIGT
jgi:hypothetical protein